MSIVRVLYIKYIVKQLHARGEIARYARESNIYYSKHQARPFLSSHPFFSHPFTLSLSDERKHTVSDTRSQARPASPFLPRRGMLAFALLSPTSRTEQYEQSCSKHAHNE